jgi:flagellar biosynthetic protein FliO
MAGELSWTQWLTMTGSFLFVIVLLVATLYLLKRLGSNYPVGSKRQIKIVDVQSLGARQKLLLVAVRGQEMLIGVSPHGITSLGDWQQSEQDGGEELQPFQQSEGKKERFKDALLATVKRHKK